MENYQQSTTILLMPTEARRKNKGTETQQSTIDDHTKSFTTTGSI